MAHCSTSRATRSTSPASCAYPIAASGCPFASHQSAARARSSRHQIRLGANQLRPQQLLEEVVVAVPLPMGVQRHQEQVGARQRLQLRRGAALLEDRVAERPGHPLEHGGPRQEAKLVRGTGAPATPTRR